MNQCIQQVMMLYCQNNQSFQQDKRETVTLEQGHDNQNLQDTLSIQLGIQRCRSEQKIGTDAGLLYHNTTQQGMIDDLLVNNSLTRSDSKKLKHRYIPPDRL